MEGWGIHLCVKKRIFPDKLEGHDEPPLLPFFGKCSKLY